MTPQDATAAPVLLEHARSARRPGALLTIGAIWVAALAVWLWLDAAWWVPALILGASLPAAVEALRGDTAWLRLDEARLSWGSARHSGTLALSDIDHVRFDTRLDFAVNARLHLVDGSVLRLPIEVVPPLARFMDALDQAGIRHKRHHFAFF